MPADTMRTPSAAAWPPVVLGRFFTGQLDMADYHAHWTRRELLGDRRGEEAVKRCCLHCLYEHRAVTMETEEHALFECPCSQRTRDNFALRTNARRMPLASGRALGIASLLEYAAQDEGSAECVAGFIIQTLRARRSYIATLEQEERRVARRAA